jgi:trimethylamine--corrinoid protein Co-methyltransferase
VPDLTAQAGVYQGLYHDPQTNALVPFTDATLASYIKLARLLPGVTGIHMQNYPVAAAHPTEPLELRIFAWRHGAQEAGGIQLTALCPYLLEMYAVKAEAENSTLPEVFRGQAFMISPLRIPAHEAEQILFFHNHGLRVSLTNMITAGGTGPVTLAGCIALNLAERIALGILNRVLYGDLTWALGGSITPLDMRTMIQPYGRPEMLLTNLANIQLARHYGVRAWPHSGLTDAKAPSHEAGVQKLMTALPCILAGGANIEPGLLSIDEVFSPVQMILDAELVSALRRALRGFEVTDDTLAVDLIEAVGPGGFFTDRVHTARHFRESQWQPEIWSRDMLQHWLLDQSGIDVDRARDRWHAVMSQPDPPPGILPDTEARLRDIVARARSRLARS